MLTYQTSQKYIQGSNATLLRNTKAERDRLIRRIKYNQQQLAAAGSHAPAATRISGWIIEDTISRDAAEAQLESMERGLKNYIVGAVCMGSSGIEYLTSFTYDISIQNGANITRSKEAQLEVLRLLKLSALTLPPDMKLIADNSIAQQESLI